VEVLLHVEEGLVEDVQEEVCQQHHLVVAFVLEEGGREEGAL
jgi:hypothetical protein